MKTTTPQVERGAALVVTIIMLLIITILAVNSMQGSIIQEQMTANQHDHQLAFQAAEAALRRGELLRRGENGFVNLPFGPTPPPDNWSAIWAQHIEVQMPSNHGLFKLPEVITEELDYDSANNTSRIRVTARGYGARQETQVVLQSIVAL